MSDYSTTVKKISTSVEIIHIKRKKFRDYIETVTAQDITDLSRFLATLLSAGVPLVTALSICQDNQRKLPIKHLLRDIRTHIESGKQFHESLLQYSQYFSPLFITLIKLGEQTATLAITLARLADYQERNIQLKKRMMRALYYPLSLILIAVIVTLSLFKFIVPQFEHFFNAYHQQLPLLTQSVIYLAQITQSHFLQLMLVIFLLAIFWIYLRKCSETFNTWLDDQILRIPFCGGLIKKIILTKIIRMISTMLASGIGLADALKLVADSENNRTYHKAILQIYHNVCSGKSLHRAITNSQLFPSLITQIIATEQESSSLAIMLHKLADIYEADTANIMHTLLPLLEPLLVVILGVLIGIIVLAMYLPIFSLGSVL